MNRSFRAQESQMQAMMKQRQQLRASMRKEKEEELALFLEMKKREKERNDLLLNSSEEFDAPLGAKPGTSPIFNISSSTPAPARKTGADDFLNSENDKNDYDWLLTPPGTPLFPSLEMESHKTMMSQLGTPKARPTALKSRLANPQPEPAARSNLVPKQSASSPGLNSSSSGIRRPSSSGGPGSRPATPTGRSTVTSAPKPSRSSTPTSRATLTKSTVSAAKPSVSTIKSAIPGTKSTIPATKSTIPSRSSTPSRSTARSSTPTGRPTVPPPKSVSRASTPTRRPSMPSNTPSISAPTSKPSPSVSKPVPSATRNPVPSRGASPTVKSRPWKPSEMPGFSMDAPPNLRTTLPDRPLSASRGRPGAPSSRSSSIEPGPPGRPRRQSCSPSRGRAPNGSTHISGSSVPAFSRGHSKVNDNVSPVLMGTKMVERVINMRKLAPPKHDDKQSPHGNHSGKSSSSPDSSGFGRSLSKKSLDMAIRHMFPISTFYCRI
ncbi:serine/arginine repetitive matrix protein 2 isoform X2 [Rosa chinensis]|uniref:serine/arginine repetitive matrix protein 2 isoform X2 n=1 Tax=Rosa chinensis TaxID=74649 RepID=UPI001AD8D92D|nr:serine/arginine repetitive matrix protein 2 isoform X2 [Rosa chinensis]